MRFVLLALAAAVSAGAAPDGEALYKQRCATCHDGPAQARMPSRQEIAARTPEAIYKAMFGGPLGPESAGPKAGGGPPRRPFPPGKEVAAGPPPMARKSPAPPGP